MEKTILVIVAHADDEALGCAGTIRKHVTRGDSVHLLVMTDGVGARTSASSGERSRRSSALQSSSDLLGISSVTQLDFPDNALDSVSLLALVQQIEALVCSLCPTIIYTHHAGDLNVDHQLTCRAVLTACRPLPDSTVTEIYSFEVLSSTEWSFSRLIPFSPNVFVDIGNQIEIKVKALDCYHEEMRRLPHTRSIDNVLNLAKFRGNSVGLAFAEAFELLRRVDK